MYILILFLSISSVLSQDRTYILEEKEILIPKIGSKIALTPHPLFDGIIQKFFNNPGSFHGPNCYNTALIASGAFLPLELRYVSPEEFSVLLSTNFNRVSSPEYKDVVVFDAKSSRSHAGLYLGDELIFHKKSFRTHYHYRITDIKNVGVVEENEWVPGPSDASSDQMKWPDLGSLPLEYYRIKSKTKPKIDSRISSLILLLEKNLINDLKTWSMAKKWGVLGQYLAEDLHKYAKSINVDKYTESLLISFKDQIYLMLDEIYFKNRSASSAYRNVCLPQEKDQLVTLLNEFGKVLKKDQAKIKQTIDKLFNQDLSRCELRPMNEMLKVI